MALGPALFLHGKVALDLFPNAVSVLLKTNGEQPDTGSQGPIPESFWRKWWVLSGSMNDSFSGPVGSSHGQTGRVLDGMQGVRKQEGGSLQSIPLLTAKPRRN